MGPTLYIKQHQPSPCAARPLQCCHCCRLQGISLATALLLLLLVSTTGPSTAPATLLLLALASGLELMLLSSC